MSSALLICVDNSEYMRNGDLPPTRHKSMNNAASMIARTTINANHESAVGLMTLGKAPSSASVLCSLGRDLSRLYRELDRFSFCERISLLPSLESAILVLKNRPSPQQRQRIVLFIGSPLSDSKENLVKMGKKLRKHGIGVDVINVAEPSNTDVLTEFVNTIAVEDNSHFINVPAGPHELADLLSSRPPFGAGGQLQMEEEIDDELRAILELSRREAEEAGWIQAGVVQHESQAPVPMQEAPQAQPQQQQQQEQPSVSPSEDPLVLEVVNRMRLGDLGPFPPLTPEQETEVAIRLSMEESPAAPPQPSSESVPQGDAQLLDNPDVLRQMLGSIPGVDFL
ncbi:hypothetical protein RCL1_008698 [Eukaryota sp. TZLM3-RCL]